MPDFINASNKSPQNPRDSYYAIAAHIGRNIQRRREDLDLTQEELGKLIYIGQESISGYERGHRVPSAVRLYQISVALECKPWELWL